MRSFLLLALLLPLLAGCLPSDQRRTSRALFPADSLSRQVAEAAPVDTLALVWRVPFPDAARYPLTLAWTEDDRLVSVDAQRGGFYVFAAADGRLLEVLAEGDFEFPLLGGVRGDTALVVGRGDERLHYVALDGTPRVLGTLPLPAGRNAVAAWTARGLFVRTTDAETGGTLHRLDPASGAVAERLPLDGPDWRHIGYLRAWGDTLVALSGYRPVVDVLPPGVARTDTLALVGFDSPQMARSRLFVLGENREPPLLSPSAVAVGERLVVLNARPGWVHLDLFRRDGAALRLERTLLGPEPGLQRRYFAADLAARPAEGGLDVVVLEHHPQPHLARYRWNGAQD